MIKLLDIVTNIVKEGASLEGDKVIFSKENNNNDLLHIGLKDADIGGVNVKYSMDYNQENPNASEIKNLADRIKNLELDNKEELRDMLFKDISSLFSSNFKPKTVYYLGSSAPLSKMIGDIIKKNFSDINVFPLDKIKFPSWKDMLVPNYEAEIESENMLKRVETAAKKMWVDNKGAIKSSKLDPLLRKYFKPKYDLDNVLEKEALMFVDDNVQTGTDFKIISDKFFNSSKIMFYTAIRLSRAGAKTTKASLIATSKNIPFPFKKEDLMKFPSGVGVKSTYNNIEKLKSKGYVSKAPTNTQGKTYYLFKNSKLTIDDLI